MTDVAEGSFRQTASKLFRTADQLYYYTSQVACKVFLVTLEQVAVRHIRDAGQDAAAIG